MPVLRRDDPDYFPLLVGNYVLGGGGFDSRLMKEGARQAWADLWCFQPFQPDGAGRRV